MIASDGLTLGSALAHLHDLKREFDALEVATSRARNQLDLILERVAAEDSNLLPIYDGTSAPALFDSSGQIDAVPSSMPHAADLAVDTDDDFNLSASAAVELAEFERSFIDNVGTLFDAHLSKDQEDVSGGGDKITLVHADMSHESTDLHVDFRDDVVSDTALIQDVQVIALVEDERSSDVAVDCVAVCDEPTDDLEADFGREEELVGEIIAEPTGSEGESVSLVSFVPFDQDAENEGVVTSSDDDTAAFDSEPELESTLVTDTPAPDVTDDADTFDIDDLYILSSSMHQPIEQFEDFSLVAVDGTTNVEAVGLVESGIAAEGTPETSDPDDEPLTAAEETAFDDEYACDEVLVVQAEAEAEMEADAEALTVEEPEASEAAGFIRESPVLESIHHDEIVAEDSELEEKLVSNELDAKAKLNEAGDLDEVMSTTDDAGDSDIETAEAAKETEDSSDKVVAFPAAAQDEARPEQRGSGVATALVGAGAIAAALTVAPQFLPMDAWQDLAPVQDFLQQLSQLKRFLA